MRKTFLAITLFLAFSKAALAQFGNCTASEMRTYVDTDRRFHDVYRCHLQRHR